MTVAATLATAPLMAFHFGSVSLVSLAANLLALPAVAPVMWLGMLAAAASQVAIAPAILLNGVNGFCLALSGRDRALDCRVARRRVVGRHSARSRHSLAAYAIPAGACSVRSARPGHRRAHALALGALLAVAAIVVAGRAFRSEFAPPARFTVTFLDVGQGDAILSRRPATSPFSSTVARRVQASWENCARLAFAHSTSWS